MMLDFSDPNFLPWLVPVGPLLAFFIISLATNRAKLLPATDEHYGGHHPDYDGMEVPVVTDNSRVLSIVVGMSGAVMALLIGWNLAFQGIGIGAGKFGKDTVFASGVDWLATAGGAFTMGVLVDPLTAVMLVMVPIAVLCIFIYSIGYMAHDPRQSRFFALISLFAGAMLTLVVADNLLLLFIGWEVMGLCSYLLIGFWFEKESAYKAAIKAFTTTRIADVIMLLGIAYLYAMTGTLNFREILYDHHVLDMLAETEAIILGSWGFSAAGLIGVFLIIGTIGKSAQWPLHVWLPDAMEGPTPVSAMIHAAAMVSAGVYAIIRMYPLLEAGGHPHAGEFTSPLVLMAVIGSITALFSATIAVAQNDVKRVLAYSTISQLGFMVAALGIGAYVAATFHLITHAFFKALLFMASGSVIHAMEHGEHHVHEHAHEHHDEPHHEIEEAKTPADIGDEAPRPEHAPHFDPQDMMNMGGLARKIPVTAYTFAIGGLSLAGFPLITAGFWSKDEILADAWLGTSNGFGPMALVFFTLALAAFLTAFYTMRQLALTFLGDPRTEEAEHASLGGPRNVISITMQLPLVILAVFALFAGFVGVPPDFPIFGALFSPEVNPFFEFVKYTLLPEIQPPKPPFNWIPVLTSFGVALGGLYLGWQLYGRKPLKAGEPDPLVAIIGEPLHKTLRNKYYFDELYELVFVRPAKWIAAQALNVIDGQYDPRKNPDGKTVLPEGIGVINGVLHLIAHVFIWLGNLMKVLNSWLIDGVGDGIPKWIYQLGGFLRGSQTGRVQQYMLAVLLAAVLIGVVFALLTTGTLIAQ